MSRFDDGECECRYENYCQNGCRRYALFEANVKRAIAGPRGQRALRDLRAALEALPQRRLLGGVICGEGEVCAIGAYAAYKKVQKGEAHGIAEAIYQLEQIYPAIRDEDGHFVDPDSGEYEWDSEETKALGERYGMAGVLAWSIANDNDESWNGTPEVRYERALQWIARHLSAEVPA